ncbi:flavodoxin family protein [Microbacterium sp. NPDC057407]|uniref:flavodoxin family protein n=1 Tax=Microbacterium sp. NPDC057407 TaxID=3346120 RepID=UPI00366CE0B5
MRALVVYESMFGNTAQIAQAVADGMADGEDVTITDVVDAPESIPPDVDLVVVGAPTHVFSLSRVGTRRKAARRGGAFTDVPEGVREWLEHLPSSERRLAFAAFDTRVDDMALLPGAASHAATRLAKERSFDAAEPASFLVEGYEGPLVEGELERAREWGHGLTEHLAG